MNRKEIKAPINDVTLNNTNHNFKELYDEFSDVVSTVSDEAFNKVVDSAKLNWKDPVDNFSNLPSNASKGDTRMTRDNGMVYRYDGSTWKDIQQIDVGPVNEVDSRLTSQLAENEHEIFKNSLVNRRTNRKLVVWQDDDGREGIYTKLAPILREYGIVLSAAIYTNGKHGFPIQGLPPHDPLYISYEQMKELENEGIIEYISHTHNHVYLDSINNEEIHYELKTSQDIFKKLGWNYKDFVYPGGRNDENIRQITSQYFESAFKVGGYPYESPYDQYAMPRLTTPVAGYDVEEKKQQITQALDNHGFIVIMGHVDLEQGQDLEKMKQLIEHCLSEGAEFVTTRELVLEYGHFMQQGKNTMTSSGSIHAEDFGVYRNKNADMLNNAPITDFPKGTVTRLRIHGIDADDYLIPSSTNTPYGYIETHRDSQQDVFSNQLFMDLPNNRTLRRRWNTNENKWDKWIEPSSYNDIFEDAPVNAPISFFEKGKVTKVRVAQTDASSYNIPQLTNSVPYGFIETHRDAQQDTFSSQTFYDIRNKTMFFRKWDHHNNNWEGWVRDKAYYVDEGYPSDKNAPITSFAKGTVTKIRVTQTDASAFNIPSSGSYGFIETHRDSQQDTFSSQVFYDINNNSILMRKWDHNEESWRDWE